MVLGCVQQECMEAGKGIKQVPVGEERYCPEQL